MIQIYHTLNWNSDWSFGKVGSRFPKDYKLVAQVDTAILGEAFELTNHIDHDWTENERVRAVPGGQRSSSVGDLFIEENGDVHLVASIGFRKMGTFVGGRFTPEKMTVWALLDKSASPGERKLQYFYEKFSFDISKKYREEHGVAVDSWEADLSEAFA